MRNRNCALSGTCTWIDQRQLCRRPASAPSQRLQAGRHSRLSSGSGSQHPPRMQVLPPLRWREGAHCTRLRGILGRQLQNQLPLETELKAPDYRTARKSCHQRRGCCSWVAA